jgi:uncharacterized protein (TIGR02757 family)
MLHDVLEDLCRHYDRRFLDTDPVGIVRRFDDPGDREIVGLIAAGLAYGRVASIRASLEGLLSRFVASFDPKKDAHRLDGFVHRFTRGRDIALLIHRVRQAREQAGSLESFFIDGDTDPTSPTLASALDAFGNRLFDGIPRAAGTRWLLPLPQAGSACKRSCLFLRWMVRPDDGVDCGVWTRVSRARLVLPLDTHVFRVVRALGWTRRKSSCWAAALEATERLRALDPDDPVRFDFALSRLGILGLIPAPGGRLPAGTLRRALVTR